MKNNYLRFDLYYIVCKASSLKREHRPTGWKHLVQGLLAAESKLEPETLHRKARMAACTVPSSAKPVLLPVEEGI